MQPVPKSGIRNRAIQKKLDYADEAIHTLEQEKEAAEDADLMQDLEEARQIQQAARESYSRGDLYTAWLQTIRVEGCLAFGRDALDKHTQLLAAIDEELKKITLA